MQFSLVWLIQTAHRIQAVSTESPIFFVRECVFVWIVSALTAKSILGFPALKIEIEGRGCKKVSVTYLVSVGKI